MRLFALVLFLTALFGCSSRPAASSGPASRPLFPAGRVPDHWHPYTRAAHLFGQPLTDGGYDYRTQVVTNMSVSATSGQMCLNFANWLVAPATYIVPKPNFTSTVPTSASGVSWGATAQEIEALQAGTLVEVVSTDCFPLSSVTVSILEQGLAATYNTLQTTLNSAASTLSVHLIGAYTDTADGGNWTAGP